jgi:hypothetical protein
MKPPIGSFPDPTTGQEVATKAFADANYAAAGPLAAAQGDYLVATLSVDQNNVTVAGTPIAFDRVDDFRGSGISLDVTTNVGRLTLTAGRTYLLACRIHFGTGGGAGRNHQLWDVTNNQAVPGADVQIWNAAAASTAGGPQGLTIPLTPIVDTEYEIRLQTAIDTDYSQDWTGITVTEIGAVQADVVGGLEFMDIIEVGADTTSVSFGASGDGLFQRALDGDVDEAYVIEYYLPAPGAGGPGLRIKPNNLTTDMVSARGFQGTSHSSGNTTEGSGWIVNSGATTSRASTGKIELQAKSGKPRSFQSHAVMGDIPETTTAIWSEVNVGWWDDLVTNISSIVFEQTAANTLKAGARFVLYRRTTANLRADSAAVYERHAMETVDPGALVTTERTVGHSVYGGSLVGVSLRVEDAVTAGDITVNVKLDGVTALTAVLDTTNSTSRVVRAAIGVHKFAADKNISVEFVPTGYDNAGSVASPVTVQVHLTNDALINPPKNTQIEGVLWYPPETAHQWDDEFDGGVISPDWTIATAISATPIDPYAHVAAGGPRAELRNSWLRAQCYPANFLILTKSILPLPTNMFVWARFKYNTPHSVSPGIFDFISGIRLGVDFDNRINFWLVNTPSAGVVQAYLEVREGAVQVALFTTKDLFGSVMQPPEYEYLGVQKLGSVYHFWVAAAGGSWQWLGTHTYAGAAIEDVAVDMRSDVTAGGPGSPIQSCDFIRFVESATFLP